MKRLAVLIVVVVAGLALFWTKVQEPALKDHGRLAAQSYVYGFPLVIMDETRRVSVGDNWNRLSHLRVFPDHTFRRVVRPNVDTIYTALWLDLKEEPVVISLPDSGGRYYVLPLYDAWTNVFASIGSRTTGTKAQTALVVGPDWQGDVPEGMDLYRSPTNMAWAIARIMSTGGEDIAAANAFQDGMSAQPLSGFLSGEPVQTPLYPSIDENGGNPKEQVLALDMNSFFNRLSQLMVDNPPAAADADMINRMQQQFGFEVGKEFPTSSQSFLEERAAEKGVQTAKERLFAVADRLPKTEGFWSGMPGGARLGNYGTRYPVRAYVALIGLGANEPEDAMYPNTKQDETGTQLVTDKNYVLHMTADQIPPVNAFWSLTAYNEEFYLPENPINRFAIGSRDDLVFNEDGSLDIYIQRDAPEGVPQANWLPAPREGKVFLNMRLYWPTERALSGEWTLPGVKVRQ